MIQQHPVEQTAGGETLARLYPFEYRRIDIAGCRVHYLDEGPRLHGTVTGLPPGSGANPLAPTTLLLLHGNPTWSFLYRELILRLRGSCRCIAPDLPGFGLSPSPPRPLRPAEHAYIVAALLDRLGLDDYVLAAHDWGGPIGLGAVQRRPRALRGLVLSNTFAWPLRGAEAWRVRLFSLLAGSPPAALASWCCNAFLALGLRLAIHRRPLATAVLDGYRAPFRERARRRAIHALARELRHSAAFLARVEQGLAAIRDRPALLCWGLRDPFIDEWALQRFEGLFSHHRTLVLPEAGHFVPEDAPAAIADALSGWTAITGR